MLYLLNMEKTAKCLDLGILSGIAAVHTFKRIGIAKDDTME